MSRIAWSQSASRLVMAGIRRVGLPEYDVAVFGAENMESWAVLCGGDTRPQMRADTAGAGEGEEGIVVGLYPGAASIEFAVDVRYRAELTTT